MLAGYTAAFIGFPDVADPGSIFDVAVARAEEITLGILCASIVGTVVLPQSVGPAVKMRLEQWFQDAYAWSEAVLGRMRTTADQGRRLKLACGAIALDAFATPLRYDTSGSEQFGGCDGDASPAHVDAAAHHYRDRGPN